jgi:Fic family protein
MKYLTAQEIARKWEMSDRRVRMLCAENKINGATFNGDVWQIPEDAVRPQKENSNKKVGKAIDFENLELLKKELNNCRPLTEGEVKRLNEEFMVNFTYNSNAIEGNTLTLSETNLVLQGITIDKKPLKDHMEAIGHKEAFYYIVDLVKEKKEISESVIKQIHSLVLMDQPQDKGVYRKVPVIITGSSHTPPQPYLIEKQMEDLILDFESWKKEKHIIEQIALFHLKFESIHPFIDGNGRTGRLLLNLSLMENGYLPINIKFTDRKKYYDCFEKYHKTNSPKAMTELIKQLEEEQIKQYLKIIKS